MFSIVIQNEKGDVVAVYVFDHLSEANEFLYSMDEAPTPKLDYRDVYMGMNWVWYDGSRCQCQDPFEVKK